MKRNTSIFAMIVMLLLSAISFTSCSQDLATSQNLENAKNVFDSKLISDLEAANSDFMKNSIAARDKNPNKPGWTKKEKINVVLSDCAGAWKGARGGVNIGSKIGVFFGQPHTGAVIGGIIGGVVCGGAASWLVAPEDKPEDKPEPKPGTKPQKAPVYSGRDSLNTKYPDVTGKFGSIVGPNMEVKDSVIFKSEAVKKKVDLDNVTLSKVTLNQQQLNFGRMHNILLSALDGSSTFSGSEICHSNDSVYNAIINSEETKELYDMVLSDTRNGMFFGSDSKSEYVMQLFSEVFENCVENDEDITVVINRYAELINASDELTEDEKNCILSGIATALYSLNYWSVKPLKEDIYEK